LKVFVFATYFALTDGAAMFRRVPLAMLSDGLILASPIFDADMRLLLKAGAPITQEQILSLHKRDVRSVFVTEKDWQRITAFSARGKSKTALPHRADVRMYLDNDATRQLDEALRNGDPWTITPSDDPFSAKLQSHGATAYDSAAMTDVFNHFHATVDQMQELLERLNEDVGATDELRKLSHESLEKAAADLDLFVCMGINPGEKTSVFTHSTSVATLAVAIGTTLGLDKESLCDLGVGCLVHDAGMLKLNSELYQTADVLRNDSFAEITKHPVISSDLLNDNLKAVPLGVRMVAYQTHERCDGSGYPRGCTADKIHPLAKIAAAADAYVALVSPRPHRPAMLPYHAVAKMVTDAGRRLFDAGVVRGLLHTISLFPIGSYVELDNGMVGKAIRANGPAYDRPVIETWKRANLSAPAQVIDLAERNDVKVVKALTSLR
jgi:HD-GYP domain-containing protein (c-di-GMP phosphodiesterase class II)